MATTPIDRPVIPETVFAAMAAKVLHAAAEIGLPQLLADRARTTAELAELTGTHAPFLGRLLRALAGLEIVRQREPDRFELTELGATLRPEADDSAYALLTMLCGQENWQSWGELVGGLRTGETPWHRVHGKSWVEFYADNPHQAENFNHAMAEHTRAAAPGLLEVARLDRFERVVDVGGGDGTLMAAALRTHGGLTGVVFDLRSGAADAQATLAAAGVDVRCEVLVGDFFERVPVAADAYVLKQVLHDWEDDRAIAILRTLRRAAHLDARVLIMERLLPAVAGPAHTASLLVDVLMLTVTGGRERREDEFEDLLVTAGFSLERVSDPIPPFGYHVLEAVAA